MSFGPRVAFGVVAIVCAALPCSARPTSRSKRKFPACSARHGPESCCSWRTGGSHREGIISPRRDRTVPSLGELREFRRRAGPGGGRGAIGGLILEGAPHIDARAWRRAAWLTPRARALAVLRAFSTGLPTLAIIANAAGSPVGLYIPTLMTAVYNQAKLTLPACFHVATEGGWDVAAQLEQNCGVGLLSRTSARGDPGLGAGTFLRRSAQSYWRENANLKRAAAVSRLQAPVGWFRCEARPGGAAAVAGNFGSCRVERD